MKYIMAKKLNNGDEVRVIAPSRSLKIINKETREIANNALATLGLSVSLGKHVEECDEYLTSSAAGRAEDVMDAFLDSSVNCILTSIGGFYSIQVLDLLDFDQIKANPKIISGYSDITVLLNAIHAKTGLVTYYGPHYSSFGMRKGNEFTIEYFKKVVFQDEMLSVGVSQEWSEDTWFLDQENRNFKSNPGPIVIQEGVAEGRLVGGNINAFRLLNGTPYAPDLAGKILFLENDGLDKEITDREFDRRLETILLQNGGDDVQGLVIGRFKTISEMSLDKIKDIVARKKRLEGKPVVYGYDFGHTTPLLTVPIGGNSQLIARSNQITWKYQG